MLDELAALVAQRPELASGVALGTEVLTRVAASELALSSGAYRHGADVGAWVMDPDGAPPAAYLRGAAVVVPAVACWPRRCCGERCSPTRWATRSGRVRSSASRATRKGCSRRGWSRRLPAARCRRAARRAPRTCRGAGPLHGAAACGRSPMAAIDGIALARLEPLLADLPVTVALVNTRARVVVSGRARATSTLLRARLDAARRARPRAARRAARRRAAALRVVAAGRSTCRSTRRRSLRRWRVRGVGRREAEPRWAPVLGVVGDPARAQFVEPVRWDAVADEIRGLGADWVLDLGPGTAVARLTAENLRGSGIRTLALASPEGRRVLTVARRRAGRARRHLRGARARAVELPGGAHLDTRYTRLTGRPPVILAGMTPTTVDAPIVAAAANAGLHDRAGRRRAAGPADVRAARPELASLLEPGREVVFNTLLLDRHLWELHIAREALLFGARRAGAPLAGLTVSAGIPDVEEAIALLDRLAGEGMRRERLQARHGRAGPPAAGDRRRRAAPHDRGAPRGRARGRAPLRGRTSRSCCSRPITSCAGARTCWSARVVGSARPTAAELLTGRGRWRTAWRRCRSTPS